MTKINQEEHLKIIEMYNNWIPVKEIAKKYNVSPKPIYKILRDNNVKIRKCTDRQYKSDYATNKKYSFNENYFEIIDTPEKAYWLGFLFADACINIKYNKNTGNTKGGSIEIRLKREDDYHLRNFIREIKGNMRIKYYKAKYDGKEYEAVELRLSSIKMCSDLIKLGCVPNKSLILKPPVGVPEKFNHAFIKGYFDGDGCIGYYPEERNSKVYLGITGTKELLQWIETILINNGINSICVKPTKSKAFNLEIYGRNNICKFYNFIYNKSSYALGRKRDKFMKAMIELKQSANISTIAKIAERM